MMKKYFFVLAIGLLATVPVHTMQTTQQRARDVQLLQTRFNRKLAGMKARHCSALLGMLLPWIIVGFSVGYDNPVAHAEYLLKETPASMGRQLSEFYAHDKDALPANVIAALDKAIEEFEALWIALMPRMLYIISFIHKAGLADPEKLLEYDKPGNPFLELSEGINDGVVDSDVLDKLNKINEHFAPIVRMLLKGAKLTLSDVMSVQKELPLEFTDGCEDESKK